MVLQVPVGVLADTLGPRSILAAGSLVAGLGSIAFALAPSWEIAAVGRTFVGVGVSVAFIAILKVSAVWFPANRFATLNGVTMFAGNLGAVIAGAPLAWLVTQTSWRVVFLGLAALSIAIGVALLAQGARPAGGPGLCAGALVGGDRTKQACAGRRRWRPVLSNPATWPGFFVNAGIAGSYLAFAGLWAVPYLEQWHGMSRVTAAQHTSLLLLGVAFGSLLVGTLSDRLGSRRGVMRLYAVLYAASWLPWLLHVQWPSAGNARVVRTDRAPHPRLHADLGRREGSEPARAFGHRDVDRQRRNLPRHGHPAATRGSHPGSRAHGRRPRGPRGTQASPSSRAARRSAR
jgi:MFS family permease